jgi:hypothetical protein
VWLGFKPFSPMALVPDATLRHDVSFDSLSSEHGRCPVSHQPALRWRASAQRSSGPLAPWYARSGEATDHFIRKDTHDPDRFAMLIGGGPRSTQYGNRWTV